MRCLVAVARHARTMRAIARTAEGADVLLVHESHGTEADLVEMCDILPGWELVGSFVDAGIARGIVFGIAPQLRAMCRGTTRSGGLLR